MQLRASLLLATMATAASAKKAGKPMKMGDIKANSKLGNKLMSSARRLNDNDERDVTWIAGYSIRFKSCHTLTTVPSEEGGGGDEVVLYNSNVVVFQLCPSSSCGTKGDTCANGAEYAINMAEFLDAYTEAKMEKQEWDCEYIRENCYCDNANDEDYCYNECYRGADMDYCVEYEGDEEFEVQRYLLCEEMENNEYYFIGPYCAEGGDAIHLGVFADAGCVNHADDGLETFAKYNYRDLPFSTSGDSLVGDECVQCLQVDEDQNNNNNNNNNGDNNNNNNNNNGDVEITQLCELLYEEAAKCETNVQYSGYSNYWYPDEQACNYINNVLPRLDKAFGVKSKSASTSSGPAKAFAWIFGISTFALAGVSYWLYTKVQRTSVDLSSQGGTTV